MQAGKLNRRITVERIEEDLDDSGYPTETWKTYCKRWASVQPLQGRERFEAQQYEFSRTLSPFLYIPV